MKKISSRTRTVILTSLTIFALFSTMMASFAWFLVVNPNSKLDTVSGDMSISFSKVSAVRYVYPFYASSNSFIDYSKEGTVKEYVLSESNPAFITDAISVANTPTNETNKRYYLVGNKVFAGLSQGVDFDFSNAYILSASTDGSTFTAKDVTLSAGSQFVIVDQKGDIQELSSNTLPASGIDYDSGNHSYKVKTAMMVNFELSKSTDSNSTETMTFKITQETRDDSAILGMTLFDPTLAKLNGQASEAKYPEAIYDQNTCLVYKIDLEVKSQTRDFILNCDVKRKEIADENGQINTKDQYDLSHYLTYRVSESLGQEKNSFLYFHPSNLEEKSSYNNDSDSNPVYSFSQKEETSLSIYTKNFSSTENTTTQTLYIAVDYNPLKISHFFTEENLGKERIDMIRDFTFYFSCKQITKETTQNSSSLDSSSEESSSKSEESV